MIKTFRCKDTKKLFITRERVKTFESCTIAARQKLVVLDSANRLEDLSALPALRLEKLKGVRKDQYSIRINDQFRICFIWQNGEAHEVEIVDYR